MLQTAYKVTMFAKSIAQIILCVMKKYKDLQ